MKTMKHFFLAATLALCSHTGFAQEVEMADALRANGKIYLVVAVLCVIFIGIVLYLIAIDFKVRQLEKEVKEKKK